MMVLVFLVRAKKCPGAEFGTGATASGLVNFVDGVVHVELAGRRNDVLALDDRLQFTCLVVDHDNCGFLFHAAPDREPDLVAGLVVFRLHDALRPGPEIGPIGDRQHFVTGIEVVDIEYRDRLADLWFRVQRRVHPEVGRLGVGLDEQRSAALALQYVDHLPRVFRVVFRVRAYQRDVGVAQRAGRPDRAVLGVDEVRAAARVGDALDRYQGFEFLVTRVDYRDPVGFVGRGHEVAVGAIPAAVVQEARSVDGGDLQILDIAVVDQQDLAGFLDVDDELRMLV